MKLPEGLRVLITGGAGFIGSHLVEKLLDLNNEVIVLDNFTYGNKISHLKGNRKLTVYRADVRDFKKVKETMKKVNIVFHMASIVGVEEAYRNPVEVLDIEAKGTANVLTAAREYGLDKVLFGSSSEVYGNYLHAMSEAGPLAPISAYAHAKIIGEEYCRAFKQEYDVDYVILRYFNVYGPRQDDRFVIPRFVKRVSQNKPLIIYGNGEQVRDFTYIEDAVNMTLLSATKENANCKTINIGTGIRTSINKLAKHILKIMRKEKKLQLTYMNYNSKRPRAIEVFNRVADISSASRTLNYKPRIKLSTGLKRYVNWYLRE